MPLGKTVPSDNHLLQVGGELWIPRAFSKKKPRSACFLGSSLTCDATGLTPPNKHLHLRDAELCAFWSQTKRRAPSGFMSCSPQWSRRLQPTGLKELPQLLSYIPQQTTTLLNQWRSLGHLTPTVKEALDTQRVEFHRGRNRTVWNQLGRPLEGLGSNPTTHYVGPSGTT